MIVLSNNHPPDEGAPINTTKSQQVKRRVVPVARGIEYRSNTKGEPGEKMAKRMRSECGFEPGTPSAKSVVMPETCTQHQVHFKFRKYSNMGKNLSMDDP